MSSSHGDIPQKFLAALTSPGLAGVLDLLSEDIVIELPFNLPVHSSKLTGKEHIKKMFHKATTEFAVLHEIHLIDQFPTPKGVVLRYTATGKAVVSGRPYNQHFVTFLEINNGLITHWIDYFDPNQAYYASLIETWRAKRPEDA